MLRTALALFAGLLTGFALFAGFEWLNQSFHVVRHLKRLPVPYLGDLFIFLQFLLSGFFGGLVATYIAPSRTVVAALVCGYFAAVVFAAWGGSFFQWRAVPAYILMIGGPLLGYRYASWYRAWRAGRKAERERLPFEEEAGG